MYLEALSALAYLMLKVITNECITPVPSKTMKIIETGLTKITVAIYAFNLMFCRHI